MIFLLHDYFQNGEGLKFKVKSAGKAAKLNAKNAKIQSLCHWNTGKRIDQSLGYADHVP